MKLPTELSNLFDKWTQSTQCPNCWGPKESGTLNCNSCDAHARELDAMLKRGIVVEYSDGTKETLTSRKSKTYKRKR